MGSLIQDSRGMQAGEALRLDAPTDIVWSGVTADATPTEIFLDGFESDIGRLIIPTNTLIIGQGLFCAFNDTDSTVHASGRFALSVANIAGTVAASGTTVEWDAAATDANPFSQYFVGSGSAGLVFTFNNTSKSIIATVTGVASKTIRWKAHMNQILATPV